MKVAAKKRHTALKSKAESAPEELREKFPAGLLGVLENDPRPRYQDDPERVYGLSFGGWNVRFRVAGEELTVLAMERADGGKEQR